MRWLFIGLIVFFFLVAMGVDFLAFPLGVIGTLVGLGLALLVGSTLLVSLLFLVVAIPLIIVGAVLTAALSPLLVPLALLVLLIWAIRSVAAQAADETEQEEGGSALTAG